MLRRLSLRLRLAALVAIGATTVTAVAALALYGDVSSEVSDAITAELRVRMVDLVADVDDPGVVASQPLIIAQVLDSSGVVQPEGSQPILTPDEVAAALRAEQLIERPVAGIGEDARLLARPIDTVDGRVVGVTATSTAPLEHVRDRLLLVLLVTTPVLTAAVTFAAWLLAGAALRPVQRMARRAETISLTAEGERLPQPAGDDEIAELGHTLNAMLARIESTIAHERALIDDASHELRTPLAVLRGELELALQEHDPAALTSGVENALEETDRLIRLADSLLTLARADARQLSELSPCDLGAIARDALARIPRPEGIGATFHGDESIVAGSPEWIDRIATNLIVNAIAHASSAISVDVQPVAGGHRLRVADDGPGFPPDLLPQAFERFARADGTGGRAGSGLGLAIVAATAEALGGEVTAANGPPLGGACVGVVLPAASEPTDDLHPPPTRRSFESVGLPSWRSSPELRTTRRSTRASSESS